MHKKTMTIVLTIFALLVIGLFLSPSALANDTAACSDCHAVDFTAPPLNRSACYLCHQYRYCAADTLTPYGWFKSVDSSYANSSTTHSIHITGNDPYESSKCANCHIAVACEVCHETIPHGSHGNLTAPILTVCNRTTVYDGVITCANSSCHTELPDVNPIPTCENCHVAVHNITEAHQSSLTSDCLSCHDNDLTIEHENRDLNCSTCHDSVDLAVQNAIATKNTTCGACHVVHADISTMHTSTTAECISCHDADLMVMHNDNCTLCHDNPAINISISTSDCNSCHVGHGDMTQIHTTTTDMTTCMNSCHYSDVLTTEHENRDLNCSTCHGSADSTVQNAISTKNTACDACHEIHGDIEAMHVSATGDCIYCHDSNIMVTHNDDCALCHDNPSVTPMTTDCHSCHVSMPHDYSCILCHGSKYDPDDYSRECAKMHKKHDDKALCGDCHAIPASTTLESSGEYCAICHGSPERYDRNDVADDVHMEHAEMDIGESGDFCYWCHGLDVPDITPKESCNNCHRGESYDGDSRRIHKKHGDEISCVGCHGPDAVLNVNPKDQCYICHSYEDYRSTYELHDEHMGEGWCDACHGSNIPVDQDCVNCHGRTPSSYSSRAIHKEHAGSKYPCVTCHVEYTPGGVVPPEPTPTPTPTEYGTVTGIITDSSGTSIEGATVSTDGYSAATASDGTYTLSGVVAGDYTVTASKSGYESQSKSVTIGPGDTVTVDFALTTAPPSIGKGYILSKNADYSTQDTVYTRSDTIYVKIWSDRIDYRDMERAEFEIKDVCRIRLTNNYDGTFTAHYDLSRASTGYHDVRIRIEDDDDNRYEVNTKIYIERMTTTYIWRR